MSELLIRSHAPDRDARTVAITPADAGWSFVGFEVVELGPGDGLTREFDRVEACAVVIRGSAGLACGAQRWERVGGRASPFDGEPDAVYAPPGSELVVDAGEDGVELALCTAPARSGATARRLLTGGVAPEARGSGSYARRVTPILMGDEAAEALLVCEVVTPAGHWSSFPPHKHDRDAMPVESLLEETYYHRVRPASGFGLQWVYTAERDLDETIAFGDRDLVLVPRGYHTVAAPPGYELYYLNVMAGPTRAWAVIDDPSHAWLNRAAPANRTAR